VSSFASRIVRWQLRHGRHDLPWQRARDPYRTWISEIMLQQTQVATVIPYFERFIARFPDVAALAAASEEDVLSLWSGLGYYARARNLRRAAMTVVERFGGRFPATFDALVELPGIGRSTAAAIAAFTSGERRAILDGNVRRVLARHAGVDGDPASKVVMDRLWMLAEERLPARHIEGYTQGLMDLGALVCAIRAPRCETCPVAIDCYARANDAVAALPGKRRKRSSRIERIGMLVIVSRGEVLLERRPSSGIWGGLWSLPEVAAGARIAGADALEPFLHAFTHFTLEVTPWLVRAPARRRFDRPGCLWLALAEIEGAALPSPVRRLLRSVSAASGNDAGCRSAAKRRSARGASASRPS
jgi:A/G-specific adenine glycosylase